MDKILEAAIFNIRAYDGGSLSFMEVCGTHTMNIARYGIKQILPKNIRLISGPGCPVCVTPDSYFLAAFELMKQKEFILASFGDLLRVPAGGTTLLNQRSSGGDVRTVYSPLDCLEIAKENPDRKIVFLSVGFETTAPLAALTVIKANQMGLKNFFILPGNKVILPAMQSLMADSDLHIDGFLLPGNVAVIIGETPFRNLLDSTKVKGAICGFEPLHIIKALESLLFSKERGIKNFYRSAVMEEGNKRAKQCLADVFTPCDSDWRGLGNIARSGLGLNQTYRHFDAGQFLDEQRPVRHAPSPCVCGEVLKGKISPRECPLFGRNCSPAHPQGPCMVSNEGACAACFMEVEAIGKVY
jgi:hydrogenase expression/formation protein HypD